MGAVSPSGKEMSEERYAAVIWHENAKHCNFRLWQESHTQWQ